MLEQYKTMDDLHEKGVRVVLRADLNVPIKNGKIQDDSRIQAIIPTLRELSTNIARTVILSHLGRPKGQTTPEMSLAPLAAYLSNVLGTNIPLFENDCPDIKQGGFALKENLRFDAREETNDPLFAKELANLGDIYINDAFSCAHRAHASTEGITHHLPSYAGRLMEKELNALSMALDNPKHPVMAIVGGAKISTKIDLLTNLVQKVNVLALGGGMANTFLYANGHSMGKSLHEPDMKQTVQTILEQASTHSCQIILPLDLITAEKFEPNPPTQTSPIDGIKDNELALDIGPETIQTLKSKISTVSTLIWNGPLGAFETEPFDHGTICVANHIKECADLISVAGGGDTVSALNKANTTNDFTYISMAGGAFLEWMEGKELPAIPPLKK